MNVLHLILSVNLVLINFIGTSRACNGYSVTVNHARNCITGSIISLNGQYSANLDKDCNLSMTGCVEILKTFKSNKVKYTVKKPPMPTMEGEVDACEALKNVKDPTMKELLAVFAVPSVCPVKASKICTTPEKKLNVSKFKNQLGMLAGTVDIKLEGVHDVGKTCVEISLQCRKENELAKESSLKNTKLL
ncbi:hypothetical protein WA026_006095 [Henosepilachna vigintioctopunctata]|uniref:Secreted protein n=1 Tax=Henosepilachna vigintioctopunctata TaxID=420089 RepID=A0AAW1TMW3_9CUCU